MANNTKTITGQIGNSTIETLPISESFTATISATSGESRFTLNVDTDGLEEGDILFDDVNAKIYKIVKIFANKLVGEIEGTFDNTLAAASLKGIRLRNNKAVSISGDVAGATAQINGQTFAAGTKNFNREPLPTARFVEPIVIETGVSDTVTYIISNY